MAAKILVASIALFAPLIATAQPWDHGNLQQRPPEIVVLPGAVGVDYRFHGGTQAITYVAPISYPADEAINSIAQQLGEARICTVEGASAESRRPIRIPTRLG